MGLVLMAEPERFHPCCHPVEVLFFPEPPRRVQHTVELPCARCVANRVLDLVEPRLLGEVPPWRGDRAPPSVTALSVLQVVKRRWVDPVAGTTFWRWVKA